MTRTSRKLGRLLAMAAVVSVLTGGMAQSETLTDALIAAYKNSRLLEQNRAVLRSADEDVAIAVSSLLPVVNFVANSTYSDTPSAGRDDRLASTLQLSTSLNLYDFGRSRYAIESAKETVLATREALIGVEQNVLLAAVNAYINVRTTSEIVALRQNNLELIQQELQAARDRFEVGEVTRTDVAIAEARLAASQSDLSAAQGDFEIAREAYRTAVGNFPGALRPPPSPPATARTLEEAKAIGVRTHPTLRQGQRQVKAAELNVLRAKSGVLPRIVGEASAAVDDDGNDASSLSLNLSQTLYQGGQLSALFRQTLTGRDQARAALLQATLEIQENVGTAWAQLDVARARITSSDEQVRAAQTAFEGVSEEAALGARTTLDVLNAEQELLDAKNSRIQADASQYLAIYSLLSAMGLLTVDHLKLGIVTYDPAAYYNAVRNAPATSVQGARLDKVLRTIGKN